MKLLMLLLLSVGLYAQTTLSGSFMYPNATGVTGKLTVTLSRGTASNNCSTPVQTVAFAPVTVNVTNGTMGALSLYASPCQVAQHTPTAIPGSASGRGATTSLSGSNLSATVTLHTGTGVSTGVIAAVLVGGNARYSPAPVCYFTSTLSYVTYTATATSISFLVNTVPPVPSTSYTIVYYCAAWPYTATLKDSTGKQLSSVKWVVPNQGSANIAVLGAQ